MGWLAIWDGRKLTHVARDARRAELCEGTIRFEMHLRGDIQAPVILWQGRTGTARDLRVLARPDGTVSFEHGTSIVETQPGFLLSGEPLHLHYSWSRLGRGGQLVLKNLQTGAESTTFLSTHAPRELAEIVPETPGPMLSVSYAGVANHALPDIPLPGLDGAVKVATPDGPVPVARLGVGAKVLTRSGREQTVRWIGKSERMARGSDAPVLLRAPYFGLFEDILVSRNQPLLLSGCEVEYLFGHEEVLAQVEDIRRAGAARISLAQPVVTLHHVLLDDHDCLMSGRSALASNLLADVLAAEGKSTARLDQADRQSAWPMIDRPSAQAWLEMLSQNRPAAA